MRRGGALKTTQPAAPRRGGVRTCGPGRRCRGTWRAARQPAGGGRGAAGVSAEARRSPPPPGASQAPPRIPAPAAGAAGRLAHSSSWMTENLETWLVRTRSLSCVASIACW